MAQVTFDNSNALTFAGVDAEMIKATDAAAELLYNGQGAGNEIGRASCRERVCLSV